MHIQGPGLFPHYLMTPMIEVFFSFNKRPPCSWGKKEKENLGLGMITLWG